MKKLLALFVLALALTVTLASCDGTNTTPNNAGNQNETPVHTHSFAEWEVTARPTCTEDGTKVRYCSCGEHQSETILSLGHTEVIDSAVAATCTATGLTEGSHCSVCNEVILEQQTIAASGHSFEDRLCNVCGEWDNSEGLEYTSNGDGTCVVSGIGACTDTYVIIPEVSPEGDMVIGIDARAFDECCDITNVRIADSVKSLGWYAFARCTNLKSVILPESLTDLGLYAFMYSASLESIVIPDGITVIPGATFMGCTNLFSVTLPDDLICIEASAFNSCVSLESIVIPSSVNTISSWAFKECSSLAKIYFECSEDEWAKISIDTEYAYFSDPAVYYYSEAKPTKVGNYWRFVDGALTEWPEYFSEGLEYTSNGDGTCYVSGIGTCVETDIIIPSASPDGYTVTGISQQAFSRCKSIKSVLIPESVTMIGSYAFEWCESLKNVTILGKVTEIGVNAFQYCESIEQFIIPDSVKTLGTGAFMSCESLVSIVIPKGVTKIEGWTFEFCDSLKYIYCMCTEEEWNNVLIDFPNNSLDMVECFYYSEVEPTIEGNFWHYADGEPTLWPPYVIPDSVGLEFTSNGDGTCSVTGIGTCKDSDIIIPPTSPDGDKVTSIGDYAFNWCTSVTNVTIPDSITSIGDYAFQGTALTSVVIGDAVTKIGNSAFFYCLALKNIEVSDSVTNIGEYAFSYCYALENISVAESNTAYESIDGNLYTKGATTLVQYAIGKIDANFTIPESVTKIGSYAFSASLSLTSVVIGDGVTEIGNGAFWDCTSLASIIVAEGNTAYESIDGNLYNKGATELIQYAIDKADTHFTIPESVTKIVDNAFYKGNALISIAIPDSVTEIGYQAFLACTSLTDVYYTGTEAEWAEIIIDSGNDNLINATIHYNYIVEE